MTEELSLYQVYRPKLFGIAYRMLGLAMDAEDIVQETFLRFEQLDIMPENPGAYLRKMTTNLCLDYLKSARVKREEYVGEWLPEPLITEGELPSDSLSKAEHISTAFLVMLETLSPLERAVFILREVLDYSYSEIAQTLDKSEAACRQLFSRAKKHIKNGQSRFDIMPDTHTRLVKGFITAVEHGNIDSITELLAEEAMLYSDGGGKVSAALRPIQGRIAVVKFLRGLERLAKKSNMDYRFERAQLNGTIGMITRDIQTGAVIFAATFAIKDDVITAIWIVRNPDKLQQL